MSHVLVAADVIQYRYYPAVNVYFAPSRDVYFLFVDGDWVERESLPDDIQDRLGNYVVLPLATTQPYLHNAEHRMTYSQAAAYPPAAVVYYYYPASNVYYHPQRRLYFYFHSGAWRTGASPPPGIRLGAHVPIEGRGGQPYVHNPEHRTKYHGTQTRPPEVKRRTYPSGQPRPMEDKRQP